MHNVKTYLLDKHSYLELFDDFKVHGFYTIDKVVVVTTSFGKHQEEFYFSKEEFETITGKSLEENLKIQKINNEVDLMNVKLRLSEPHQVIGELKIKQPIL